MEEVYNCKLEVLRFYVWMASRASTSHVAHTKLRYDFNSILPHVYLAWRTSFHFPS